MLHHITTLSTDPSLAKKAPRKWLWRNALGTKVALAVSAVSAASTRLMTSITNDGFTCGATNVEYTAFKVTATFVAALADVLTLSANQILT